MEEQDRSWKPSDADHTAGNKEAGRPEADREHVNHMAEKKEPRSPRVAPWVVD